MWLTCELVARGDVGVQVERAEAEAGAELEQRAQVERGDVRLRPALAALLDVLLELNPPAQVHGLCSHRITSHYQVALLTALFSPLHFSVFATLCMTPSLWPLSKLTARHSSIVQN